MDSHFELTHHSIGKRPSLKREYSIQRSTEWNNRTDDTLFLGPYAHIRKNMDYSYHSNYIKTRQWLQDSIIEKLMGELVRTRSCNECELMISTPNTPSVLNNGSGIDIWAMPKDPWLVMVAGNEGTHKRAAIKSLLENDRLPMMGFVLVDPQEIRMLLPEYSYLEQKDMDLAMELTEKETGYIIEILSLAALEAGTNVVVYGFFKEVTWYQQYCERLKRDFKHMRIAMLHIVSDNDGEGCEKAFNNLIPYIDYFCCLKIFSKRSNTIEIMTDGVTWDSFTKRWKQSCAWVPDKTNRRTESLLVLPSLLSELYTRTSSRKNLVKPKRKSVAVLSLPSSFQISKASRHHDGECSIPQFSIEKSTEEIHASKDMYFYGPYAHIRRTLDYSYHCNYTRERQLLQDAIIADFMTTPKIVDADGQVGTTPTEPFIVFTAGAMGAGKGYVLHYMERHGYFPLPSFVIVDPDDIRSNFPEYNLYKSENPFKAGELTRKEAGYMVEILTYAAMESGKNVLVDGSLRDWEWYREYFTRLREEYSCIKISILHIDAPRDAIIKRATLRGVVTGRKIPQETLEMAIKQVPISVAKLKDQVDCYYKLDNSPSLKGVQLMNEGITWSMFQDNWLQTCAWISNENEENSVIQRNFSNISNISE